MGRIIAVANQKGGVGKTTTAVNLAAALAYYDKQVLLVDSDAQGNATSGLGINKAEVAADVYDVLINDVPIEQAIMDTTRPNMQVVPATIQLAGGEVELTQLPHRERKMKEALEPVRDRYDFILIDCPPSLGNLTINSFTAADAVLIPVQSEYYALEGLSQLLSTIQLVQRHFNPELMIEGVVMTMVDMRTNLSHEVVDEVRRYFGDKVYETLIPRTVRLSEAPSYGQSIIDYDPNTRGAQVYLELAKEVLAHDES